MKLGLLIALTPDRRSVGRVLSPLMPLTEAVDAVKKAISANKAPDARFPVLQAVNIGGVVREHRFRPTAGDLAEAIDAANNAVAPGDELNAALAANGDMEAQATRDEARITELEKSLAAADVQIKSHEANLNNLRLVLEESEATVKAKSDLVTILEGQLAEANKRIADSLTPAEAEGQASQEQPSLPVVAPTPAKPTKPVK